MLDRTSPSQAQLDPVWTDLIHAASRSFDDTVRNLASDLRPVW